MKIKILTLNLFEGGLFWENIRTFLLREDFDILCLQEAFNGDVHQPPSFQSIRRLNALLPGFYSYYSPELFEIWPHGQGDGGNLIYSRFPLSQERTIFLHKDYQKIHRPQREDDFSHYPKNLQHVVATIGEKKLHVCNMHGIWGLDGGDTSERLLMSDRIVKEIAGKSPLILTGDFNLKPNTQTIAHIEKHLRSLFAGEMETSFNMRHKTNPGYATAVVDMMFASTDIKVVEKKVCQDDVSDHVPLSCTIKL